MLSYSLPSPLSASIAGGWRDTIRRMGAETRQFILVTVIVILLLYFLRAGRRGSGV